MLHTYKSGSRAQIPNMRSQDLHDFHKHVSKKAKKTTSNLRVDKKKVKLSVYIVQTISIIFSIARLPRRVTSSLLLQLDLVEAVWGNCLCLSSSITASVYLPFRRSHIAWSNIDI